MDALFSIAVVSWLLMAAEVACQTSLSESDKMDILATHNRLRGMVDNPPAANMSEMVRTSFLSLCFDC